MDLEHLNKTQIIFLALLVSFVTSIATGIVTVSLVNQAPPQMQAAVNHIIERTIQQVTPSSPSSAPTTIKTVVVKSDDLAAQSIASVQKSIIRLVSTDAPDILIARGIIIDAKGVAITDHGSLNPALSYLVILPDGSRVPASVLSSATTTSSVALLELTLSTTTAPLVPATFADPSKLQLGQTVIRIGGTGNDTVGAGVVAMLPPANDTNKTTPRMLEASVSSATPGSVLITLFGEVVGIVTTESLSVGNDFYSMPSIFKAAAQSADATNAAAVSEGGNASQTASVAASAQKIQDTNPKP